VQSNEPKEMNDKLFDAILQVAAEQAEKNEYELQPTTEELNNLYPPSEVANKRIRSFIDKERRTIRRVKFMQRFAKTAAIFVVVLSICTTILMSVEASRNFILNTFVNIQEDHVAFDFRQEEQGREVDELGHGYIPYGFELLSRNESDRAVLTVYVNSYGEQLIIQQSISTTIGVAIDNERREFSQVIIDGQNLFVFEAYDTEIHNVVMRQVGNDVFIAFSTTSMDNLILVVTNITN
jgi:hypothetical protein